MEAITFTIVAQCPELVLECIRHYNTQTHEVRTEENRLILKIQRSTFVSCLRTPERDEYSPMDMINSQIEFICKKEVYRNVIAKNWIAKPKKGKSQLPHNLHKNHFVDQVAAIVVLLHRVRGSENVHSFEEWMYFFI